MPSELTIVEIKMAQSILRSSRLTKPMHIIAWLFLIIGAMIIVATIFSLFGEIDDTLILYTGLPGFITGILFLLLFIALRKRIAEIDTMASILKKLSLDQKPEIH